MNFIAKAPEPDPKQNRSSKIGRETLRNGMGLRKVLKKIYLTTNTFM